MSTQHPDNVTPPFFAENHEMGGEDEIQEAYYAFSHLGCDEQMWDCEGKEVDDYVVKKLLTKYGQFFSDNRLGRDIFLTLRVPNPEVEREEAKILLETLESIPRSFDTAHPFYDDDHPPIFEVILPMASSAPSIDRIYKYYRDFVVGKKDSSFEPSGMTVAQWIGDFRPETVNVIPLFEDMENMLNAHTITRTYLEDKDVDYQRVFLARSDPALNYGLVSAVLLNWISLQRLEVMSRETGVQIKPIIGIGSAPFRGNFRPSTVERLLDEYSYVHTFTVQSAFKYDNPHEQVRKAVGTILDHSVRPMAELEEETALDIIMRYSQEYKRQIVELAPMINEISKFVPSRRKRKLHIGLFGYSRSVEGVSLPRAIRFTASLYSIGIPPELLGLNALNHEDLEFIRSRWSHFDSDIGDAIRYMNPDSIGILPQDLQVAIRGMAEDFDIDEEHQRLTRGIFENLRARRSGQIQQGIVDAARIRRFLG
jgi:phosphoenolpyruvate carboxylase